MRRASNSKGGRASNSKGRRQKNAARRKAYRDGVLSETLAALLFRLKGYRILERRYRSPVGEIDLVALKGSRLVFVEVKRRKTEEAAAYAITAKQKRRIVRAAQYWLAGQSALSGHDLGGHDIAFDVVLSAPWTLPRHIRDAFQI